jgi:hypothetical protein
MSNRDPYSDSPGPWLVGTTKVYPGPGSRHCHGINYTQNPAKRGAQET